MPKVEKDLFCKNCQLQVWERPGVIGVYEDTDGFTVCVTPGFKHELIEPEFIKFTPPRAVIGPWGTPIIHPTV